MTNTNTISKPVGYESIRNALALYGANLENCNYDAIKNSDVNCGAFLTIRTDTAMARIAKNIKTQNDKMAKEDITEAEKQVCLEKIAEYEAEEAIIKPINEALHADNFAISREIAIYAYGADSASVLHLEELDTLKQFATKIRNMGNNHYVHVKSLAETKKAKTPDTYKEMKKTMQGMLNVMLPDRNLHINGDAVFAMCNILVTLTCKTDKDLGLNAKMKYTKIDTIIRQMCKIASILLCKREKALQVTAKKEQVKQSVKIEKDSEKQEKPAKAKDNEKTDKTDKTDRK